MNIQQMQYYREVCRWQNITRAAQELHMAQPTLSLVMRNIERETGLNLFRHVGRNIQMTADGETLYHQVGNMLRQIDRFEAGIQTLAQRHSKLQLAVPSQIGTLLLPLLLGEFHCQHPAIQLEITEPAGLEALEMVEKEEVDLAILHDGDSRQGLTFQRLIHWPICLCLRTDHPLAKKKYVTLNQASSLPLVMLGRNFIVTRRVLEEFQNQQLQPNILHFSTHLSTVWNLVKQNIAAGIMTGNAILPDSNLCAIPIDGLQQCGYIFTKTGRQIHPDQKCLMQFIRQHFAP